MNSSFSPRIMSRRMSDDSIDLYADIERSLHLRTLRLGQQKTLPSDIFRRDKEHGDKRARQHNFSPRPQHVIFIENKNQQSKCLQKFEISSSHRNDISMRRKTESNSRHTIENGDNRLSLGNGALHHNMVVKNQVFPGSSQRQGEGIRRKPEQASNRLFHQSQVIQNPPMRRANTAVNVTSDSLLEILHRRCQSERHNRSLSIEAFQNKKNPLNQDNLMLVKQRSLSQPRCYPPQQKGTTPNTSAKSPLTSRMNLSSQATHVQSMRLVEKELRNQNIPTTSISPRVRNQRTDIPNWRRGTRTNLPTTTTSTKSRNESNTKRFDAVKPKDCKVEQLTLNRARMSTTIKSQTSNRHEYPNYIRCLTNFLSHSIHDDE